MWFFNGRAAGPKVLPIRWRISRSLLPVLVLSITPLYATNAMPKGGVTKTSPSTRKQQSDTGTETGERASFVQLEKSKLIEGSYYTVSGHTLSGDGGEGTFLFTTTLPQDSTPGVVYFVPGRGYLIRQGFTKNSRVYAEWFGAHGDGIHDDAPAIQRALDTHGRVMLLAKTYGVGKGLFVDCAANRTSCELKQRINNIGHAINVKTNDRIEGTRASDGRYLSTIKLISGTNPRQGRDQFVVYDVIGNHYTTSAANVTVRDLIIDVNFDGQSKEKTAPKDSVAGPDGKELTRTNPGEVATLNAVRVYGPSARFENLRVVGYSSNTIDEAFVVSSGLVYKDASVGRQCATIRNVEMTSPGSNLEIKYRRFGGAEQLKKISAENQHIAEITHIAVGGSNNFTNSPYRAGFYSIPSSNSAWEKRNRRVFSRLPDALADASVATAMIVEISKPAPVRFQYLEDASVPADGLVSFNVDSSPTLQGSGRLVRATDLPKVDYIVEKQQDLVSKAASITPSGRKGKVFLVKQPEPEFYYVDSGATAPSVQEDGRRIFKTANNRAALIRISPPQQSCDHGWGCDPAFAPSHFGENADNWWPCEGGSVEGVYIHDESTNPYGYNTKGEIFGLSADEVKKTNASNLHGITYSDAKGLIIERNLVQEFMGPAVFVMSWWNDGIRVRYNYFDGVLNGVSLASFVQDKNRALQFPRHRNVGIGGNYIRLIDHSNTYTPTGFAIGDNSNGTPYRDGATTEIDPKEFPRFDNIRFVGNRIVGRPVAHGSKATIYPRGISVYSRSFMRNVRIDRNSFDIAQEVTMPIWVSNELNGNQREERRAAAIATLRKNGTAIRLKRPNFTPEELLSRQTLFVHDNLDLQGRSGDTYEDLLSDLKTTVSVGDRVRPIEVFWSDEFLREWTEDRGS